MKPYHKFNHEDMPLGMLINHLMRIHMDKMRHTLESYGVQKTYGPILKNLSEEEGITQSELADTMRITAPSMSINLQKMEAAELLMRKNDASDMRQVRLYLTEKGRAIAERTEREIALLEENLVKNLTNDETKELRRIIIKMLDNFDLKDEKERKEQNE